MMYTILLDQKLERRGYKDVQQKADACGIGYEVMRQILKGEKHPCLQIQYVEQGRSGKKYLVEAKMKKAPAISLGPFLL